ncbi:hypothetical protein [Nocardia puris]|uniref:Uncharacterized protein n=1 Tax=Nocardia puris TaxID=208602 RepID=A0A366CTS6_9NOCA|nr:hypothetical protein [Nocardia puris]RBO79529.1 hypothetical protein DFR74_1383 [Nocardia puris]
MSANPEKHLIGNRQGDRVSLFFDGRVKVWSTTHLWTIVGREAHNALGETVHIGVGDRLDVAGPTGKQHKPDILIPTEPERGREEAATICADNGTFVQFFHDGSISVGNDGREFGRLLNAGREFNPTRGHNGVGGSVMILFEGSYRPRQLRTSAYPLLAIPEAEPPRPFRLYKDEFALPAPGFE